MEEKLVEFETAKLAKEVGFPQYREGVYYTKDKEHCLVGWGFDNIREYSAPTQSLLQKYLRDVFDVHITISRFFDCGEEPNKFLGFVVHLGADKTYDINEELIKVEFKTYEEALERGLVEGLKIAAKKTEI